MQHMLSRWTQGRARMVWAVSLSPGSPELLPLFFLPRPSTFNYKLSPSVCWDNRVPLQGFPVLTTAQHRWTQTRQIWMARKDVSVIIAQTTSVCEGGGQAIFTEALTFRNLPQCHIWVLEREEQRCYFWSSFGHSSYVFGHPCSSMAFLKLDLRSSIQDQDEPGHFDHPSLGLWMQGCR